MGYKKIAAAVLSLIVCMSISSTTAPAIYGENTEPISVFADLNCDGKVNALDAAVHKKTLLSDNVQNEVFDINADTEYNSMDLQLLSKYVLGINTGQVADAEAPVFSAESGFYDKEFNLTLSTNTFGGKIFYTTDGSDPSAEAQRYKTGIDVYNRSSENNVFSAKTGCVPSGEFIPSVKVDKSMVIKAVTCDTKGNISEVVTNTYFVGLNINSDYNNLAVISILTDEDNLWGYENGIFMLGKTFDDWMNETGGVGYNSWEYPANYNQRGKDWEREVHIELFENDGKCAFSQNVGMRTMGNASRSNNQKSLRFYAREEYSGSKNIKYELIPGLKKESDKNSVLKKYKTFVLRSGGNDADYAKLRDPYIQSLVSDRSFDTQGSRPVIAFINGEYWGIYSLQEDYTDNYIENNYDVNNDDVVMVKNGEIEEGNDEDISLYQELIDFAANNDLSDTANYNTICNMMDMDSFVDYYCTELYIGNQDWVNYGNNISLWRSRTVSDKPYYDGKWRWMLFDTEYSLGLYNDGKEYNHDTLSYIKYDNNGNLNYNNTLFENLLKNDDFKQKFVTTFMDIANVNFSPEHASRKLDEMAALYEPLMNDSYSRFGPQWVLQYYNPPKSYFKKEITNIKYYLNNRYNYVQTMIKNGLDLSGASVDVTLGVNNSQYGTVKINSSTLDMSSGTWNGKYFTDYPITITAIPSDGYSFSGWTGDVESSDTTITVPLSQAVNIQAVFD